MAQNSVSERVTMADRAELISAQGRGWLSGFGNILGKEVGDWFATRRWLVQSAIWLIILNGNLAVVLFVVPLLNQNVALAGNPAPDSAAELYLAGLSLFFNTLALLGSIGIVVLTQDEIIQEKQAGTAAWVLTKPVSRASFILSKLASNIVGALVFIIVVPALIAYFEILVASGRAVPLIPYVEALAVILLTLTFYITLSLMLGTFFEQRGPLLAGTFGVMIGGLIVSQFVPKLSYILPLSMHQIALAILQGQPLSPAMGYELITAGLFSALFTVAALWRFGDEEF